MRIALATLLCLVAVKTVHALPHGPGPWMPGPPPQGPGFRGFGPGPMIPNPGPHGPVKLGPWIPGPPPKGPLGPPPKPQPIIFPGMKPINISQPKPCDHGKEKCTEHEHKELKINVDSVVKKIDTEVKKIDTEVKKEVQKIKSKDSSSSSSSSESREDKVKVIKKVMSPKQSVGHLEITRDESGISKSGSSSTVRTVIVKGSSEPVETSKSSSSSTVRTVIVKGSSEHVEAPKSSSSSTVRTIVVKGSSEPVETSKSSSSSTVRTIVVKGSSEPAEAPKSSSSSTVRTVIVKGSSEPVETSKSSSSSTVRTVTVKGSSRPSEVSSEEWISKSGGSSTVRTMVLRGSSSKPEKSDSEGSSSSVRQVIYRSSEPRKIGIQKIEESIEKSERSGPLNLGVIDLKHTRVISKEPSKEGESIRKYERSGTLHLGGSLIDLTQSGLGDISRIRETILKSGGPQLGETIAKWTREYPEHVSKIREFTSEPMKWEIERPVTERIHRHTVECSGAPRREESIVKYSSSRSKPKEDDKSQSSHNLQILVSRATEGLNRDRQEATTECAMRKAGQEAREAIEKAVAARERQYESMRQLVQTTDEANIERGKAMRKIGEGAYEMGRDAALTLARRVQERVSTMDIPSDGSITLDIHSVRRKAEESEHPVSQSTRRYVTEYTTGIPIRRVITTSHPVSSSTTITRTTNREGLDGDILKGRLSTIRERVEKVRKDGSDSSSSDSSSSDSSSSDSSSSDSSSD